MKTLSFSLLSLLLVCLAGCGYKPLRGALPQGGQDVCIPIVENRTPFSGLAGPLTSTLRRQTTLLGLNVVRDATQSSRVEATIVSVKQRPGMLTVREGNLIPLDSIISLSVEVSLLDRSGETLIEPQVLEVQGRAYSGNTVQSEESAAKDRREGLLDDVAEMIAQYLFLK